MSLECQTIKKQNNENEQDFNFNLYFNVKFRR